MKVNVSCDWGGTIPSYEFKRDVPLADHIATICSELKATDAPENYALFVESTFTYVRPEVPSSLSLLLSGLPFCRIMDERESSVLPLLSSFCPSSVTRLLLLIHLTVLSSRRLSPSSCGGGARTEPDQCELQPARRHARPPEAEAGAGRRGLDTEAHQHGP